MAAARQHALMSVVIDFFSELGVPIAPIDDTSFLIADYAGVNGRWDCFGVVDDDTGRFAFYSAAELDFAEQAVAVVMEYLMRASSDLMIGSFELDVDEGHVLFKTGIDVEGERLTTRLVENVVLTNVSIMDHHLPGLAAVASGRASAVEAIAAIGDG